MSTFKSIHCTGDAVIDGNLTVMGGYVDITPTLSFTTGISNLISYSRYYPHLKLTVFSMRVTRKSSYTFDGSDAGTSYTIAKIPSQYAPSQVSVALSLHASIGSLNAMVHGAINSEGEITLRMNGKTNPTYFYFSGSWITD